MKSESLITDLRQSFPLLQAKEALIYLDSAATTQKPSQVIDAMSDFYRMHYATVHRSVYTLAKEATEAYYSVRRKVHSFLNAKSLEEIIFTRGTTASLNLLAQSFGAAFLKEDDIVLVPEIEHHSNIVPWQMACKRHHAKLQRIPVDDNGEIIFEAFEKLLSEKVKMVSLAHISNVLGTLHPLEKIIKAAHAVGACVCVDGAQSAAHLPVDVQQLDVDFYAFSAHKMYGPTGIGVLYGKKALLEKMSPIEGGGDMIESVNWEETTYQPLPLKFEAGTPMIVEAIGLGAAIDYLNQVGLKNIAAWEHHLLEQMTSQLLEIPGLHIVGTSPSKGPIISFSIEGIHPLDLATLLDCKEIALRTGHLCSQPTMKRFKISSLSRVSFGLYNHEREIERFIYALREIMALLT